MLPPLPETCPGRGPLLLPETCPGRGPLLLPIPHRILGFPVDNGRATGLLLPYDVLRTDGYDRCGPDLRLAVKPSQVS